MGKIEEKWDPFEIQVNIEGETKSLLVMPDREMPGYAVFDQHTLLGRIWKEPGKTWCAEGVVVNALLAPIGEQIEEYLNNKPL